HRFRRASRPCLAGAGRAAGAGRTDFWRARRSWPGRGHRQPAGRRLNRRPDTERRDRGAAGAEQDHAMNLALKDIRHGLFRFVLTCFGLGLLMTVVLSMIGIYNGLVADALAVVKVPAADVWVV